MLGQGTFSQTIGIMWAVSNKFDISKSIQIETVIVSDSISKISNLWYQQEFILNFRHECFFHLAHKKVVDQYKYISEKENCAR